MGSYAVDEEGLKRQGISLVECPVEKMPFADQQFDCAVMCHVLEHCGNISLALAEVRRVLRRADGCLLLFPRRMTWFARGMSPSAGASGN